jgi:hypothetical protein
MVRWSRKNFKNPINSFVCLGQIKLSLEIDLVHLQKNLPFYYYLIAVEILKQISLNMLKLTRHARLIHREENYHNVSHLPRPES